MSARMKFIVDLNTGRDRFAKSVVVLLLLGGLFAAAVYLR
jgi:hypothetical protein